MSNAVAGQTPNAPNARGLSGLFWHWGQFLHRDITETLLLSPTGPFRPGRHRGSIRGLDLGRDRERTAA